MREGILKRGCSAVTGVKGEIFVQTAKRLEGTNEDCAVASVKVVPSISPREDGVSAEQSVFAEIANRSAAVSRRMDHGDPLVAEGNFFSVLEDFICRAVCAFCAEKEIQGAFFSIQKHLRVLFVNQKRDVPLSPQRVY